MLRWDALRVLSIGSEPYHLPNARASGQLLLSSVSIELKEQALVLKGQPLRPSEFPKGTTANSMDATPQIWLCGATCHRCR